MEPEWYILRIYIRGWVEATKPNIHNINVGLVKKAYLTIRMDNSIIADVDTKQIQ